MMNLKLPSEFKSYKPKVSFCIEEGNFIIKIAETQEELMKAFHLRHNVFCKERKNITLPSQLSIDEFDIYRDQLLIIKKKSAEGGRGLWHDFFPERAQGQGIGALW